MSDAAVWTRLVECLGTAGKNSPGTKGENVPTSVAELFKLTNMVVK